MFDDDDDPPPRLRPIGHWAEWAIGLPAMALWSVALILLADSGTPSTLALVCGALGSLCGLAWVGVTLGQMRRMDADLAALDRWIQRHLR